MEEKVTKVLTFGKDFLLPIISAVIMVSIAWTQIDGKIQAHDMDLKKVEVRVTILEQTSATILQRLASIDTKLDYITKALDKLTK